MNLKLKLTIFLLGYKFILYLDGIWDDRNCTMTGIIRGAFLPSWEGSPLRVEGGNLVLGTWSAGGAQVYSFAAQSCYSCQQWSRKRRINLWKNISSSKTRRTRFKLENLLKNEWLFWSAKTHQNKHTRFEKRTHHSKLFYNDLNMS